MSDIVTAMTFQKIAIAGATGFLGRKVLSYLLTIAEITKVTVLTRSNIAREFPSSPKLSIASIHSYDDHNTLTSVLSGHDLVISTVGGLAAQNIDALLIDAAISAHVQRFMPSEYTLDVMHPQAIAVAGSTVLAGRLLNVRLIQSLAERGEIEYTTLIPAAIMDWWFENGNLGVDFKAKKMTLYDGGEKEVTGCSADFIAQCVGAVVRMPPEATRNRRIHIAEVKYSGKLLSDVIKEVTGEDWEVEEQSTNTVLEEGNKTGASGNTRGLYLGNILKLNFDGKGAAFFKDGLKFGNESVTRRTLKEIVAISVRRN